MAKIVNITFLSDTLEGSRIVHLHNNVCRLYDLMREDDTYIKDLSDDLDTPALYILLNRETNKAYIGQTDCFQQRLSQHSKKEFWNEVLAFIASDGSINATEVQYLEAIAYNEAKNAGTFDLSENSQVPKAHKISASAKYSSQEFFQTVCDLAKIVGCNIFIHGAQKKKRKESSSNIISVKTQTAVARTDSLQGTGIKMYLNGRGPFNKRKFVLEVVREFLNDNPQTTIPQLKEVFPKTLLGSWGNWNFIETNIEAAKNLVNSGNSSTLRHFVNDDCILTSPGDRVRFVVASQWDYNNLPNVLSLIRSWGWEYEITKKNKEK
jgi:hypothetical protein